MDINSVKSNITSETMKQVSVSKSSEFSPNTASKRKISDNASAKKSKKLKNDDSGNKEIPLHMLYAKQPMLEKDIYNETQYYFEQGLRKVWPYYFEYNTFAKGRWLGKTLREVYTKEFRRYPIEFYEEAAKTGNLLINKKNVKSLNVRFTENSMVTVRVHRHEYAVADTKIEILVDDDQFLVVNKPSSIPIHPCGRYRNNTLIFILAKDFGYKDIFLCHRIDRLTSGIVIFAKSKQIANKVTKEIADRKVQKEYLCKVAGEFPSKSDNKLISCNQPVTIFNPKLGYAVAWEINNFTSKEAYTEFERLSTNGKTSIVLCRPKTGRTHQIRVHLQYLGFPILNDPVYNHEAWGEERFRHGKCSRDLQEISDEITSQYQNKETERRNKIKSKQKTSTENLLNVVETVVSDKQKVDDITGNRSNIIPPNNNLGKIDSDNIEQQIFNNIDNFEAEKIKQTETKNKTTEDNEQINICVKNLHFAPDCEECLSPLPDPLPNSLTMCLHAYKYKGTDWNFETDMPEWCDLDKNNINTN